MVAALDVGVEEVGGAEGAGEEEDIGVMMIVLDHQEDVLWGGAGVEV